MPSLPGAAHDVATPPLLEFIDMPRPQVKSFAEPDEVRTLPLVRFESVSIGEGHVGHCTFDPGWRWASSMGPLLGTASCPIRHVGYTVEAAGSHELKGLAGARSIFRLATSA